MIWCVDHDAQRRNMEIYTLRCVGMDVKGYDNTESFWEDLHKESPELILMDGALPGVDSPALMKRIRRSGLAKNIPIIMMAKCSDEFEIVRCLDSGADDCLGNPVGMMEMVSRVKAVLRRSKPQQVSEVLQVENIMLSLTERSVSVKGQLLQLSYKEFELLKLFMEHPGEVLSRKSLHDQIWGGTYNEKTRTVDIHIQTLRKKLGESGYLIESVKYIGYRMKKAP